MKSKMTQIVGLCGLSLMLLAACSSVKPEVRGDETLQQIKDISVQDYPDWTEVTVTGEKPIVYTAFRLSDPERLIVDMANTSVGQFKDKIPVDKGALIGIVPIEGEAPNNISRLELTIAENAESRVKTEGNNLVIDIEKTAMAAEEAAPEVAQAETSPQTETAGEEEGAATSQTMESSPASGEEAAPESAMTPQTPAPAATATPAESEPSGPPATVVSAVSVSPTDGQMNVMISGDGAMKPDVFKIGDNRLVVDIPGVSNAVSPNLIQVGHSPVQRIRIGQHADPKKVRVVLDLDRPVSFDVMNESHGLMLSLSSAAPATVAKAPPMEEAPMKEAAPEAAPAAPKKVAPAVAKTATSSQPAFGRKKFTGRKVSLDFQDADLDNVLRLMADVSGMNIVLGQGVKGKVTVKLKNVPWDQALDIILKLNNLGQVSEGNILQIDTLANISKQRAQQAAAKAATAKAEDLVTRIVRVNYADAENLSDSLQKNLSPRGSITVDKRTNTMIVKDVEKNIEEITVMARSLDTQTPQVLIEARIVQADRSFAQSLGITWGAAFRDIGATSVVTAQGGSAGNFNAPTPDFAINLPAQVSGLDVVPSAGFTFGRFTDNPFNLDLRLSAGELSGVTKTISSPRVITLDNTEAKIEQGESIPFQTTSLQGTQTTFVDANLVLQVTPHVTAEGSILMKVKAARNALGSFSGPAGPSIARRQAQTVILLNNGETTVIGGIYVDETQDTTAGVPWLSKIPVIGWLFKNVSKTDTKNELLIFLTPRIVKS